MPGLVSLPAELLNTILKHLHFPHLQMLRGTCRFFRDYYTDAQIHESFMAMQLDVIFENPTFPGTPWQYVLMMMKGPHTACLSFMGPDTHTPAHVQMQTRQVCECGRPYYNISRPGVVMFDREDWGSEGESFCSECRRT